MSEKDQRQQQQKKDAREKESGSSTHSKTKHCVMNKVASGSEDVCPRSIEKEVEHPENKEVTIVLQT